MTKDWFNRNIHKYLSDDRTLSNENYHKMVDDFLDDPDMFWWQDEREDSVMRRRVVSDLRGICKSKSVQLIRVKTQINGYSNTERVRLRKASKAEVIGALLNNRLPRTKADLQGIARMAEEYIKDHPEAETTVNHFLEVVKQRLVS